MPTFLVTATRQETCEIYVVAKDAEHAIDAAAMADPNAWTTLGFSDPFDYEVETAEPCHKDDPRWYDND